MPANEKRKWIPLVDSHAHVLKGDLPLIDKPARVPDYDFTPPDYLATLDKHGVQFAVLSAGSLWGDYNDYLIDAARNNPRLRTTACVSPAIEHYTMREMRKDGVVGVRLTPIGINPPPDYDNFEHRRLFRRIADLDWHLHLHVDAERLPQLMPVLERSGVKIVLDHLGRVDPRLGIESEGFKAMCAAVERGRTWIKLSAPYRTGELAPTIAKELLRRLGPDRLMWGSDCPFTGFEKQNTYQGSIDWLLDCVERDDDRRKIFGENALKLCFT